MNADVFVDTNVCLYIHDKHSIKFSKAKEIIESYPIISTQVILESINICIKKLKQTPDFSVQYARSLQAMCIVKPITNETISLATQIFKKYKYRIFDSLIVASALESNCKILYSEDMQHGQVIDERLVIINPFFE